jgi:acetyl esterase/lipase
MFCLSNPAIDVQNANIHLTCSKAICEVAGTDFILPNHECHLMVRRFDSFNMGIRQMRHACKTLVIALLLLAVQPAIGVSDQPERIRLWSHGAPESRGDTVKDQPSLQRYSPDREDMSRAAVIVFPGGGYGNLAMDHEGEQIATWLIDNGVHAFVCDYRHRGKGYGHPVPMLDAKRAIRFARANSRKFNIDADKIGVLGFSAGGHLASTAATHFDSGNPESQDAVEQQSSRPDFAILCYPVIAMGQSFTHQGSQRNLLGKEPSEEMIHAMSNERHVTMQTPPTFLWHGAEDAAVPPANSIVFFQALQSAGVVAELHVYAKGGHGIGLAAGTPGAKDWPAACIRWLKAIDVIE